ncbi:very large A-kinase anchor protein [Empidonax traillii]|uniref:very large A-kinase anchor protein n=1 Tax=Empidonax traillii TaxID=164674 RepID=UPI000FFDB192|nr:very large A-kinase anchor protein [Empidonax traillii]
MFTVCYKRSRKTTLQLENFFLLASARVSVGIWQACQNEEKNHSTEELCKSEIQEELKKANSLPSLTPGTKTADKDKQPREGFFHFLGSLFNIATKSSLVESKPSTFQDEPNRCEKDLQNTNTFPKDVQPKHPKIEEPLCSTARKKEDSVTKGDATLNNIGKDISQDLQGGWKQAADTEKHTRRKAEAPAVTYATYRGSARIRQLLKSQSEVTGKGEENPENRNVSMVKENGEIQRTPSLKSGCPVKEDGRDESEDPQGGAALNPSALRGGSKQSGKAQHGLGRSKHEITAKATTSSTGPCHEPDVRHEPALAAAKVKRTFSLDSLLSFSNRNGEIPTNSTSRVTPSLKVSSANDLSGKEDGSPGEAEALFQTNKNATFNLDKEKDCSKAANKESPKEIQDNCLRSSKSKSKTFNEELQVGKGGLCRNHQLENHSERLLGVQMLHFGTITFQQEADQQTGSANKGSDPRKSDTQKIVATVEREQNPRDFPAAMLLPFNEQLPASLSVESSGEKCVATGDLRTSVSSAGHDEGRGMGRETWKEPSDLGRPVHVQNGHKLIHVQNSRYTITQQPGLPHLETEGVETMKVLSEVAVENVANVSPCLCGCQSVKTNLDELTAPLSVTSKSSVETGGCCSASLHPTCRFQNKTGGKREISLKGSRETLSHPDLEYEKSKSFETVDMTLSKNTIPVHNLGPLSLETIEDSPTKTLTLVEDNTAPCPLINHTPASSKTNKTGMTGADLITSECEDCILEFTSPISKSREKNLAVSRSALGHEGRPLTNFSAFTCEKGDVGITSESPPVSEKRYNNFSSKKENSNKPRISPTVLDSSSDSQGKMLPSATNSENGQIAASQRDSFILPVAESRRTIPEGNRNEGTPCSGDPRALSPAGSLEREIIPPMLDSSADGVNVGGVYIPRPTSASLASREASNLSVSALKMSGIAQGNSNSSSHRAHEGAEEAFPPQADSSVLAEAMPPPSCPLEPLGTASEPARAGTVCRGAGGQVGHGACAPAESAGLCSEGHRGAPSVKGQEQAALQDAALFRKAEEIVGLVLHLATEEIIAKQAFGVCQPCYSKDSLVNRDILSYQKAGTVQLEAGEIQSAVQSLKDFNESSGGGSSSFTGNERVDTNNQDEKTLSCIPDKIDLHNALALKAKETVEEVINSAIQKLAPSQWQGTESKRPSEKAEPKPEAEIPKTLNLDTKFPAKTQEPTEMKETRGVTVSCEKEDCSDPPWLLNSVANGIDWPQRDEKIPKNAITCQANGFPPSGSLARPESDLDTQLIVPELSVPGEDSEGKQCFNTAFAQRNESLKQVKMNDQDVERNQQLEENGLDCNDDMKEPTELLASSPLIEQWENSSFTIIYEGALHTENKAVSTDDVQARSLPSPGLPSDNTDHPACARAKDEHESACPCGQDNKLNGASDGRGPESFLSVEARRYRVYPFSLSPIYEDDSSQEDLLSTDVSPESRPGGISKDNSDHASVLSLLQSVSERLQFTTRFSEEEEEEEEDGVEQEESSYEENTLDAEGEEDCISSQWRGSLKTTLQSNDQNKSLLRELPESFLLSKEQLDSQEQPEQFPDVASPSQTPCKSASEKDGAPTHPPTSVYYQYLKSASTCSSEKGTRFGSVLQDMLQPKIHWSQDNTVPKLGELSANLIDRASLKYNPRPGKIVIYDTYGNKSKQEVHSDVPDTSSWNFPIGALLRIIRGCWIFYEKPKFQGRKYVLEEGEAVLDHLWDLPGVKHHRRNLTVGSIKHVTKDCGVPEVEFCLAAGSAEGLPICIQGAIPNLEELDVEKNPYIRVKSGVWLAYSDFNYKGEMMVLEESNLPSEIPSADVKSLRPLKMGGLKVQMPMNVKIIIYEKTHFGGWSKEFSENITSVPALFADQEEFQEVGSIRVIGGVWVAYDKERYKGHQYLLEEGDYEDRRCWGGTDSVLLSFRFLQADFIESSVALFQSDEDGKALDITNEEVPDLEKAGFGPETRSILVRSGVWVAYKQKYFCGEQYVLEKGKYKCFFDWGGSSKTIMSIRPVKLEPLGMNEPPHLLKAFSNTHFQGACIDFTAEVSDFTSFIPCSFKVLRGCWLLCYEGEITDNHCVLEEGLYADLSSCGCPTATIKSLKPIQYVFAEPSISLFTLECCKGRELHFSEPVSSVLNEDLHFCTQSVWVRSGLWIAYEGCNFLGRQILLEPSEISNWNEHSGWKVIGSLRPMKQPAVYLRVRNRAQGRYLTVAGSLADVRATSVCASPYNGRNTQVWHYCRGLFKSRANNACLDVIGGRDVPGAKVALWAEHGKDRQKWRFKEDGTISSYLSERLVLDIKGGNYYDKNHIIMNQPVEDRLSQKWDIEVL